MIDRIPALLSPASAVSSTVSEASAQAQAQDAVTQSGYTSLSLKGAQLADVADTLNSTTSVAWIFVFYSSTAVVAQSCPIGAPCSGHYFVVGVDADSGQIMPDVIGLQIGS